MTDAPLDLSPIEDRDAHAECVDLCHQPQADRRALLAEVKRLRVRLEDEHEALDSPELLADLSDVVHTGRVHQGGPCHGDNDGCQGGPDQLDLELGETALEYVHAALGAAA